MMAPLFLRDWEDNKLDEAVAKDEEENPEGEDENGGGGTIGERKMMLQRQRQGRMRPNPIFQMRAYGRTC